MSLTKLDGEGISPSTRSWDVHIHRADRADGGVERRRMCGTSGCQQRSDVTRMRMRMMRMMRLIELTWELSRGVSSTDHPTINQTNTIPVDLISAQLSVHSLLSPVHLSCPTHSLRPLLSLSHFQPPSLLSPSSSSSYCSHCTSHDRLVAHASLPTVPVSTVSPSRHNVIDGSHSSTIPTPYGQCQSHTQQHCPLSLFS
jgi:hypothetical protein